MSGIAPNRIMRIRPTIKPDHSGHTALNVSAVSHTGGDNMKRDNHLIVELRQVHHAVQSG